MENIFSLLRVSNLTTRAYCKISRSILISSTSICYCYSKVYLRLAKKITSRDCNGLSNTVTKQLQLAFLSLCPFTEPHSSQTRLKAGHQLHLLTLALPEEWWGL